MLDVDFVRQQFPSFSNESTSQWAFFENAGGSYVPKTVSDWLHRFFTEYKVQPYGLSAMSIRAGEEMDMAYAKMAQLMNAKEEEITLGPSTTMNMYVIAQAVKDTLVEGDEIIVTNQDHEANIGCWRRLEQSGLIVKEWGIDPVSGELGVDELRDLVSERTRLICFSLCSNVVGTMNDVSAVTDIARDAGALVVADGVSYAPHCVIDVQELGVDFVLFSTYKTFGTHIGVLWGEAGRLAQLPSQSHYFNANQSRYRMNPTGPLHAEIAALNGLFEYYDTLHQQHFDGQTSDLSGRAKDLFGLFAEHESALANKLLDYLRDNPKVRLIGKDRARPGERAATISFIPVEKPVDEVAEHLARKKVGVGLGNFYAVRCIEALGIPSEPGVIRVSMVHYNTAQEVDRCLTALAEAIE
ncbi:MAG: aminotransferase class V-fold PLP-dependent enzyme [Arenicellales bacterium]|nr:aminotransferase class V-fold PLP-dependent enzyme [Arenicellales bacterium]